MTYGTRYSSGIADAVAPHCVQVKFIHSGWAGDQSDNVEEFRRLLPWADGVVLMHLMRTNFGRNIRRLCGSTPWRGVEGGAKLQ